MHKKNNEQKHILSVHIRFLETFYLIKKNEKKNVIYTYIFINFIKVLLMLKCCVRFPPLGKETDPQLLA